ncbi:MAG: efflux RND transporter permease subunit, partial [Planctomycetia bacterium]|nr:efflux RND transporter permease subunit [Planctomycetia bacterium]
MIDRIIELSIRHRWLVIMAGLALAVWGIVAVYQTPIDAIPDLSESQVVVFAEWSGHSPLEIDDQVTFPLTTALQGLRGVDVVRASSDPGFSMINVIFAEHVDRQTAREQVSSQLAEARLHLPPGVTPRLGPDAASTGQIFWYVLDGAGVDLGQLRTLQEWTIRPQLGAVPGVAEVANVGGMSPEYVVEVDPRKLAANGVPLPDLLRAIEAADSTVGGNVIHQTNAEYLVRGLGRLGARGEAFDAAQAIRDIERIPIDVHGGFVCFVEDVATASIAPRARRGSLEMDGNEVVGGVVMIRAGENPLEVTRRVHEKLIELSAGLPEGVAIVPVYDRTSLIEGAVGAVTGTLIEAILSAAVCVLIILLHFRTSFVIAITLPLATLASFVAMWTLRRFGIADIQTNIMSLAGLVVSIGVLVDSSIVMAENVMHRLHAEFGDRPVTGDVRHIVLPACRTVGRPMFFAILIMLLSFLPVFALGGLEGKMFRPLAYTKSFALIAVGVLAITLVPALCTIFVRGRLRGERASWVVRSVVDVYRPVLEYLLDRPLALVVLLGATLIVGFAPLGSQVVTVAIMACLLVFVALAANRGRNAILASMFLVVLALTCKHLMAPLGWIDMPPLDEGMVMDMPITIPRASISQSTDDMKARDMVLCRFPEVRMVVGKAGRAESAADPAPLDMIETMVDFRPVATWPARHIAPSDASRIALSLLRALTEREMAGVDIEAQSHDQLADEAAVAGLPRYDALMREYCYQRQQEFIAQLAVDTVSHALDLFSEQADREAVLLRPVTEEDRALVLNGIPDRLRRRLGQSLTEEDVHLLWKRMAQLFHERGLTAQEADLLGLEFSRWRRPLQVLSSAMGKTSASPDSFLMAELARFQSSHWRQATQTLDDALAERGPATFIQIAAEELLARLRILDRDTIAALQERQRIRTTPPPRAAGHHGGKLGPLATIDPHPMFDALLRDETAAWAGTIVLRPLHRHELIGFGGELNRALQMPGWTNVWTTPIQNRVDMLTTGVNTTVGIRVLGHRLDDVVDASQRVAKAVCKVPGAVNVVADPIRGKA